ncbi:MAG: hypothetical protein A3H23_05390 [Planctomycetes bacterium RIFCSPLOWO2_12_FULL_40_19]|nr:MAG: hypothetical protein A3H23_05390 [Planctomycetes bacterium RIFCSPLOWO2_12_FULL_40_19]
MSKIPSMSSKQFIKLLEKGGAIFVRQKRTDHAIYSRYYNDRRYSAPVLMGKKTLDPNYCKRVFRQLKFSDEEIAKVIQNRLQRLKTMDLKQKTTSGLLWSGASQGVRQILQFVITTILAVLGQTLFILVSFIWPANW